MKWPKDYVNKIVVGDALKVLQNMPDESVHCCVTSPPYWGLRDYGVSGQLGLERTPTEYVKKMVRLFRELKRVLRKDGTLWLNLGDCYATGAGAVGDHPGGGERGHKWSGSSSRGSRYQRLLNGHGKRTGRKAMGPMTQPNRMPIEGLKPKDLVGMPWRIAFALQADGWYLRRDIIWHKPNPMPESARDRPTTAHEYVFLMSKNSQYHYDGEAIKEDTTGMAHSRGGGVNPKAQHPSSGWDKAPGSHGKVKRAPRSKQNKSFSGAVTAVVTRRNKRSVWTISTKPYGEAHFATFPPDLITPCILAGTSEKGVCSSCGAPHLRIVERKAMVKGPSKRREALAEFGRTAASGGMVEPPASRTVGWEPGCKCGKPAVPAVVLDPFMGAGTTGLVAAQLQRNFVGIELNPEYAGMARKRIAPELAQGKLF